MIHRFVPIISKLKALKNHGRLMWNAFKHPLTPKWIKGFMIAVVVYLLSPLDLIPDFALILGLTDDALVVTFAMWFLGKVIPDSVRGEIETTTTQTGPTTHPTHGPATRPHQTTRSLKLGLETLGIVLLVCLLVLAVATHPEVQRLFN